MAEVQNFQSIDFQKVGIVHYRPSNGKYMPSKDQHQYASDAKERSMRRGAPLTDAQIKGQIRFLLGAVITLIVVVGCALIFL